MHCSQSRAKPVERALVQIQPGEVITIVMTATTTLVAAGIMVIAVEMAEIISGAIIANAKTAATKVFDRRPSPSRPLCYALLLILIDGLR